MSVGTAPPGALQRPRCLRGLGLRWGAGCRLAGVPAASPARPPRFPELSLEAPVPVARQHSCAQCCPRATSKVTGSRAARGGQVWHGRGHVLGCPVGCRRDAWHGARQDAGGAWLGSSGMRSWARAGAGAGWGLHWGCRCRAKPAGLCPPCSQPPSAVLIAAASGGARCPPPRLPLPGAPQHLTCWCRRCQARCRRRCPPRSGEG